MQIKSVDQSYETGIFLGTLADLIEANISGAQVQRRLKPGKQKGEILVEVAIGVGASLTAAVLYDLFKLAIRRVGASITRHDHVEINGNIKSAGEIDIQDIKNWLTNDKKD